MLWVQTVLFYSLFYSSSVADLGRNVNVHVEILSVLMTRVYVFSPGALLSLLYKVLPIVHVTSIALKRMQHPHLCVKMSILQSKVLVAPVQPVGFAECWLADQFNSLSPLFLGLRDLLCFYTYQINWRDMWSESPLSAGNHLIATVFVLPVLFYYIMKMGHRSK